jgi:succinyl-CoA synthetase beta subunit
MNLHEYQAKSVLRDYGIATPRGVVVASAEGLRFGGGRTGRRGMGGKAQIHAGGRGKAGGVQLARSLEELRRLRSDCLAVG